MLKIFNQTQLLLLWLFLSIIMLIQWFILSYDNTAIHFSGWLKSWGRPEILHGLEFFLCVAFTLAHNISRDNTAKIVHTAVHLRGRAEIVAVSLEGSLLDSRCRVWGRRYHWCTVGLLWGFASLHSSLQAILDWKDQTSKPSSPVTCIVYLLVMQLA